VVSERMGGMPKHGGEPRSSGERTLRGNTAKRQSLSREWPLRCLLGRCQMLIVAILAIRNEEGYLPNCLTYLMRNGISFAVIDNGSTDSSQSIVHRNEFRSGLVKYELLPFCGYYAFRRTSPTAPWLGRSGPRAGSLSRGLLYKPTLGADRVATVSTQSANQATRRRRRRDGRRRP